MNLIGPNRNIDNIHWQYERGGQQSTVCSLSQLLSVWAACSSIRSNPTDSPVLGAAGGGPSSLERASIIISASRRPFSSYRV